MTTPTYADQIARGADYLETHATDRPVEVAWGRLVAGHGTADDVIAALARYQNDDGGMGSGLEPDIAAPQSNPFAARIALQVIAAAGIPTESGLVRRLVSWLEMTQDADGCWRWGPGVLDAPIAPWFAHWSFPSLNPALDLSGWLARLGLGSERLHARCRALYGELADTASLGDVAFYELLPYAEALPWLPDLPGHDAGLDALAERIGRDLAVGTFPTAVHAADLIGPPDGPIARRLGDDTLRGVTARAVAEQRPDGSWPTPYGAHWVPWQSVNSMALLATYPVTADQSAWLTGT